MSYGEFDFCKTEKVEFGKSWFSCGKPFGLFTIYFVKILGN